MKFSSKKTNSLRLNNLLLICTFLLLYFFINSLNYSYSIEKNNEDYLIPIGKIIQIDGQLENLIVRNDINESPLKSGDIILEVNDNPIKKFNDISDVFFSSSDNYFNIKLKRKNQIKTVLCHKNILKKVSFSNSISGFATLTFINPTDNTFGAVGHSINIGNSKKIPIKNGSIALTNNLAIEKSHRGSVGCINAQRKNIIGNFSQNTEYGIKGDLKGKNFSNYKKYKIANLSEVKPGKAQIILQNQQDICQKYDIEILKVENQEAPCAKTFKIKITDEELLNTTGGIVQGMSGTPIIQNDKIIGAISHALENNPQVGYGIYIGWML